VAQTPSVKDIDLGWGEIKKNLLELSVIQAEVGHYEEDLHPSGLGMAELAQKMELGFVNQLNILVPPRPFHEFTSNRNSSETANMSENVVDRLFKNRGSVKGSVTTLGLWYARKMKEGIEDFSSPANRPYTIERKGFDNPLVDEGDFKNGVKSKVVDRKEM